MSTQTPREIAFEDIKKGDDIEVQYAEDGVTFTRRGIAHERGERNWYTEAEGLLAGDYDGWTYYLLHRPVTAEPKGLGAVVRARVYRSTFDRTLARTLVRTAGRNLLWVDEKGSLWHWDDFDPESIEVLSEGIEVES